VLTVDSCESSSQQRGTFLLIGDREICAQLFALNQRTRSSSDCITNHRERTVVLCSTSALDSRH